MAAKKQPVPVKVKSKSTTKKNYVKIPKSVGVIGMKDKIYHKLMIQAVRDQSGKRIIIEKEKE